MSFALRIFLIIGALIAFAFVAHRIKRSMVLMGDAIFWIALSILLIILALFPEIAVVCSAVLGIISPSNFVFLLLIVILLAKMFANSTEISMLKNRVNELAQESALLEKRFRDYVEEHKETSHKS